MYCWGIILLLELQQWKTDMSSRLQDFFLENVHNQYLHVQDDIAKHQKHVRNLFKVKIENTRKTSLASFWKIAKFQSFSLHLERPQNIIEVLGLFRILSHILGGAFCKCIWWISVIFAKRFLSYMFGRVLNTPLKVS